MYFKNLDALRTIACFAVIFQHALKGLEEFFPFPLNKIVLKLTGYGELGVQFFFTLSGFLITYLILQEKQKNSKFNIFHFYMRRLLRIWPLYFLVLFFAIIIMPHYGAASVSKPFMYPTFLSNFAQIYFPLPINRMSRITWSVAIEEQFYIIWPLIFLFKRGNLFNICCLIIASLLFKVVNYNDSDNYYFSTFSNMLFLAVGGLSAYLYVNDYSYITSILNFSWIRNGLIYIMIAVFIFDIEWFYKYNKILADIQTAIWFAFIILIQCFGKNKIFEAGKFKLFSYLGKYTYGMYLVHPIIIFVFANIFFPLNILHHSLIAIGIFIATIFVSMISYHLYEIHFLKLKSFFTPKNKIHEIK